MTKEQLRPESLACRLPVTNTMTKEEAYETGVHFGFSAFPYDATIQGLPDYLCTGPLAAEFALGFKDGFDYADFAGQPYEQGVEDLTFVFVGPVPFFWGGEHFTDKRQHSQSAYQDEDPIAHAA